MSTTFENKAAFIADISRAHRALASFAELSQAEIDSVSCTFKELARDADAILARAATIVARIDTGTLHSVLSALQCLCLREGTFQKRRLDAASRVIEQLQVETELLSRVMEIAHRQESIASHLKALSMLTNIEAVRMGGTEAEFHLLARELSTFATGVLNETLELTSYTDSHRQAIHDTHRGMAADLPHLQLEIKRMEDDFALALRVIESSLGQLTEIPQQFDCGVRHTAGQVAGVIVAVQAQDITRQQAEHVQQSLQIVISRLESGDVWPLTYAALKIQDGQLKMIRQSVCGWISQISECMTGIHSLSAAELVSIGPLMLNNWRELSAHLTRFYALQKKSQGYGSTTQKSIAGLADLRDLVSRHMSESQGVRARLRLLTFNSLIEATQLGQRGDGVSAIARLIRDLSLEWNTVTDDFQVSLDQIVQVFNAVQELASAFSDADTDALQEDQEQTKTAAAEINHAAVLVAEQADEMQRITKRMQGKVATFARTKEGLVTSLAHVDTALAQVQGLICRLEERSPQIGSQYDVAEVAEAFSGFYATEAERHVLEAVLGGTHVSVAEPSLAGNSVELF